MRFLPRPSSHAKVAKMSLCASVGLAALMGSQMFTASAQDAEEEADNSQRRLNAVVVASLADDRYPHALQEVSQRALGEHLDRVLVFVDRGELHLALVARGDRPQSDLDAAEERAVVHHLVQRGSGHAVHHLLRVHQEAPHRIDGCLDREAFFDFDRHSVFAISLAEILSGRGVPVIFPAVDVAGWLALEGQLPQPFRPPGQQAPHALVAA